MLSEFWARYSDAEGPMRAWIAEAENTTWNTPHEIKTSHGSASIVSDDRVVFNIKKNTYRIIVAVDYAHHVFLIKFVGTHAQYDEVDALGIGLPDPTDKKKLKG